MPLRVALVWREPEDLQRVTVRIAEIECADSPGILVPSGKQLRPRRRILNLAFTKPVVGAVHVADDDGNMLEPSVVATRIGRCGAASWGQELRQFDVFVAQAHPRHARVKTKYT